MLERIKQTIRAAADAIRQAEIHKKNLINIKRDWAVILIVAVAINVLNIGLHVYMIIDAGSTSVHTDTQSTDVRTIDRSELKEVLRTYEQKQVRFNTLLEDPPNTVDPAR